MELKVWVTVSNALGSVKSDDLQRDASSFGMFAVIEECLKLHLLTLKSVVAIIVFFFYSKTKSPGCSSSCWCYLLDYDGGVETSHPRVCYGTPFCHQILSSRLQCLDWGVRTWICSDCHTTIWWISEHFYWMEYFCIHKHNGSFSTMTWNVLILYVGNEPKALTNHTGGLDMRDE